ncbi:MAG: haloacid dehalogenase type II [Caldilineaceae bacterium]|nr:haloacid dehalogenase type II [Caldilineaceae bacterium]
MPQYQIITFDVYTALFDIQGSLAPVVTAALGAVDGPAFVNMWRRKQMEYVLISNALGQGRVAFSTITRRALDYTLAQTGATADEDRRRELTAAWLSLRPWPEAADVLTAVKARGYTIGLLSNGDSAMLHALLAALPPVVSHVFASEEAGHYKPHPAVYALPLQALRLAPTDLLHVAGSATDVMGTKAAGLPCLWSNRAGERVLDPALQPDYTFANLRGVLEIL